MGRKKENIPQNIKRFTIQMDNDLYTAIRISAYRVKVKTYELVNRIMLLGIAVWSKRVKSKKAKIDVNAAFLATARTLSDKILANEKIQDK